MYWKDVSGALVVVALKPWTSSLEVEMPNQVVETTQRVFVAEGAMAVLKMV